MIFPTIRQKWCGHWTQIGIWHFFFLNYAALVITTVAVMKLCYAKIVIVGQPNPKERSGTDNTKQTKTNTPKQHQTKATVRSLTNRWKCETRWNGLTLSLHQKSPALTTSSASCSQWCQCPGLCSNRHCPLQPAPLLCPGIPHIFIQSNSKEHMGDLAGNYSCFHELIIQRSRSARTGMSYSSTPASRHEKMCNHPGGTPLLEQAKQSGDQRSKPSAEGQTLTDQHATNAACRPMQCVVTL